MHLLIFGASGKTGQHLVQQALQQGHKVSAFMRSPDKLKVRHRDLAVIQGDVINAELVRNAVVGKDAVISALGAASPFKLDKTVIDGIANIVSAMEVADVRRFIYMSAINVTESRPGAGLVIRLLAPLLLRTETEGHESREAIIRQSQLDWTIVRAGGLTNGPQRSVYRSGEHVRAKGILSSISRADVADFLLKQVSDTRHLQSAVSVMY